MFSYLSMNEVIQEGIRDTNKERNLRSADPVFCDRFKKEWNEVTARLLSAKSIVKSAEHKQTVRYSANGVEFR